MDYNSHRYYQGLVLILIATLLFCFTFLPTTSNYLPNSIPMPTISVAFQEIRKGFWLSSNESELDAAIINELVGDQLINNKQRILSYKYHPELQHIKNYLELFPAYGGNPVRNMVVTTWRSGSTFLGDLMQAHPVSFYHYEPLLPYGIKRLRDAPLSDMAMNDLYKLMKCNYTDMEHYTMYAKSHAFLLSHNGAVWSSCKKIKDKLCFDAEYLAKMCEIYPFQNIKTVRLQTSLVEKFLKDASLGIRILLLVRDPRGTMQSRHHRDWCPGEADCENPKVLCDDLLDDYNSFKKFSKKYPKRFKAVRYEDLSLDTYNMSRKIFDFFRLTYDEDVEIFLDTHTKADQGGVSSTYRDSKNAPIHWRSDLTWTEIKNIQEKCSEAMRLWGYRLAHNASHALSFNPIGPFNEGIK